jgi:DNA-binding response OmpR family regulator
MRISLHSTHSTRPSPGAPRVVIIDDDAEVADSMADALRANGCDVQVAYDSADGIDAVAQQPTDCVLIDIDMPRIDGLEVARCLREVHRKGLVLIGITAAPDASVAVATGLSVFDHCLAKPLDAGAVQPLLPPRRV